MEQLRNELRRVKGLTTFSMLPERVYDYIDGTPQSALNLNLGTRSALLVPRLELD